ncbi:MAG: DUF1013 domain-containing protein, partial [Alphaproteobacteria bacterium]|nr:DUF1013 domain-containing protein [Alphaproteobacteria bacterium]
FEQIADFCGIHSLEVQAIADEEVASGIIGQDPTSSGQLTAEEIKRCELNQDADLRLLETSTPKPRSRSKGARYTPISKRQDRPDAILWLLKHHPEIYNRQICNLIGTTKATIDAISNRTHRNIKNITPRNPVTLGLCSEDDLEKAIIVAKSKIEKEAKLAERQKDSKDSNELSAKV